MKTFFSTTKAHSSSTHTYTFLWKALFLIFGFLVGLPQVHAQISSPGVSSTQGVTWGAIGLTQHLGHRWISSTYVGEARESDPNNWSILKKQGLLVLNQEVGYGFNAHWQLSLAGSFRQQNKYSAEAPYESENPAHQYETRYYSRLHYKHKIKQVAMTYTFRPELRTFHQASGKPLDTPEEVRVRMKAQASLPLNSSHTNYLIGGNEILTATDKNSAHSWTPYQFTEDRFSVYFRHVFAHAPVVVDLGLMEQFKHHGHKASYLAFDILLQDPFGKQTATP